MYDHTAQTLVVRTGVKRTRAEFENEPVLLRKPSEPCANIDLLLTNGKALSNPLVSKIWKAVHGATKPETSRLEQDVRQRLRKGESVGKLLRRARNLVGGVGSSKTPSLAPTETKAVAMPRLPLRPVKQLMGRVPLRRVQFEEIKGVPALGLHAVETSRENQRRRLSLVGGASRPLYTPIVAAC